MGSLDGLLTGRPDKGLTIPGRHLHGTQEDPHFVAGNDATRRRGVTRAGGANGALRPIFERTGRKTPLPGRLAEKGRPYMVEMPGVEPGSEWTHGQASTCVVDLLESRGRTVAGRQGDPPAKAGQISETRTKPASVLLFR